MSYLFAFSYYSWSSQGKNTEWFAILFSSGPHFFRTLHHESSAQSYIALQVMGHSFIELCKSLHHDKAVIHVIILLAFCDCGFQSEDCEIAVLKSDPLCLKDFANAI